MVQMRAQRQPGAEDSPADDGRASLRAYRNQLMAELREVDRILAAGRIVATGNTGFPT